MNTALREIYFWLVANPLVLFALMVAGAATLHLAGSPGARLAEFLRRSAMSVTGAVFLAVVLLYYTHTGFIDHVEPQIAAVAWLHHTGAPIYPALDGAQVYAGGPYGAGTILLVAAAFALGGPSLIAAKLASAFALAVALASMVLALRREAPGRSGREVMEFLGLIALPYGAAFWLRADPSLLAVAALAALSVCSARRVLATAGCALCLGAILWLKVHGALYLFPTFVVLAWRHGRLAFLGAGITGVGLGLAQFLPWIGHGENFLALLRLYGTNRLDPSAILPLWQWAALWSAPLWLLLLGGSGRQAVWRDVQLRWPVLALAGVLLVVGLMAARPGLGYWHFLPLAPAIVVLAARVRAVAGLGAFGRAAYAAWWLTVALLVFTRHDDVIIRLAQDEAAQESREIDAVRKDHPGRVVLMGLGSDANGPGYRRTFQRAHLVIQGEPYPYDPVVMMDYRFLGAPDEIAAAPELLPVEQPALMLIPAGESPWSMGSVLGGPGVPAGFRARFFAHYQLLHRGERYDVWQNTASARLATP